MAVRGQDETYNRAHVPDPSALDQIGDERVELAEAVRDAGEKTEDDAVALVLVK